MTFDAHPLSAPQNPAQLLDRLLAARILADSLFSQVIERSVSLLEAPVNEFAALLAQRRIITRWQSRELLAGRIGLFIEGYKLLTPHFQTARESLFIVEQQSPQKLMLLHLADQGAGVRAFSSYEFVECRTLADWLATNPEISPGLQFRILAQAALATIGWGVDALRRAGPEQLLLLDRGVVRMLRPFEGNDADTEGQTPTAAREEFLLRFARALGIPTTPESTPLLLKRLSAKSITIPTDEVWPAEIIRQRRSEFQMFLRKSPPLAQLAPLLPQRVAVHASCFLMPVPTENCPRGADQEHHETEEPELAVPPDASVIAAEPGIAIEGVSAVPTRIMAAPESSKESPAPHRRGRRWIMAGLIGLVAFAIWFNRPTLLQGAAEPETAPISAHTDTAPPETVLPAPK